MAEKAEYAKCGCENCGGHIEFPAELAGTTVDCPHCHFATPLRGQIALTAAGRAKPNFAAVKVLVMLLAVGGIGYGAWTLNSKRPEPPVAAPETANPPMTNGVVAIPTKPSPPTWNGLEGGEVKLEKVGEGNLIYAVGTLRNTSEQQKFGVKVKIDLWDAEGAKIGLATDYAATIDAGKEWRFRALVVAHGAVTARIGEVTED